MTKSRFNTFVFGVIIIGIFIFLIVSVTSIFSIYSGSLSLEGGSISPKVYLCLSILGLIIFILVISKIKIVLIDHLNQQIIIKNRITQKPSIYNFFELDGYYDIAVNHSGKMKLYTKAIGISKNEKIILIVDSYYCSNLSEMRDALDKLKYLGTDINWVKQNF